MGSTTKNKNGQKIETDKPKGVWMAATGVGRERNKHKVKSGSVEHKSHLKDLSVPMFGLGMLRCFDNLPNIATI